MCSCCDPTSPSPDPVVVRLEAEVERWTLNVADAQGRIRELHEDNARLRGLLREAVEAWHSAAYRRTFLDWRGNMEWGKKAQAALEGKL